ncbi:MAG: hypothetical protein JNG85_06260 [Spirochaetaceae bacterium]|nr:hypothetical protein [Spirochaetaceae bacterium]
MRPAYGNFIAPSGLEARYAAVPAARLPELRAEYERSLAGASVEPAFRAYVDDLGRELPPEAEGARTILACVVPARHAIARLLLDGEIHELPLPSGYWDDGIAGAGLAALLREAAGLKPEERLTPVGGHLPAKLLAAKCGLVAYGRNGISYAEGLGSSIAIRAFATDAEFAEADFGEARALEACAACRACRERCPTGAIKASGFGIDAGRCLSLHNEVPGDFPPSVGARTHNALIGCLRCQEACPANRSAPPAFLLDALDEEESAALLAGDSGSPRCPSISAKLRLGDPGALAAAMEAYSRNLRLLLAAREASTRD